MMRQLTGIDMTACPCCNHGKMKMLAEIPRHRALAPTHLLVAARQSKPMVSLLKNIEDNYALSG
jgi:hypothetical protein